MKEYNSSKNKLFNLWKKNTSNSSDLENKDNTDELSKLEQLSKNFVTKNPIVVGISDEFVVVPEADPATKTAVKGAKLPSLVEYKKDIYVTVPEEFLPFIQLSTEVKPVPNVDINTSFLYEISDFAGDNILVESGATTIYKGDGDVPDEIDTIFDEATILAMGVSLTHTKKAWRAEVTKSDDSNISGILLNFSVTVDDGTGCGGNAETTNFTINHFEGPDGQHEITALSSTEITGVGDETIITWTGTFPSCVQNTVVNKNVTRTLSLTANDYSFQAGATPLSKSQIKTPVQQNQTFTEVGKHLYWSSSRQKRFVSVLGASEGDFQTITLGNFPNTDDGDSLPYGSFTAKRNLTGVNEPEEINKTSIVGHTEKEFKNWVKVSKSTQEIPTYVYKASGEFFAISESTTENPDTTDFPVYDDVYTVVGVSYSRTTTDHTILSKTTYLPDTQDVKVNIKAVLVNPLHWQEDRRYKADVV